MRHGTIEITLHHLPRTCDTIVRMKPILVLQAVIILMVTLLCASASAQQKNLTCLYIFVDGNLPGNSGQEIHITLDEANSQAKSDEPGHDDGNFHPARFTPNTVTWTGGQIVIRGRLFGPLRYELSRTTGKMVVNDNVHFQCEVAQQKF